MSRKEKNYMPQSGAGLMRFSEDDRNALQIKPEVIIAVSSTIGLGLILLRLL